MAGAVSITTPSASSFSMLHQSLGSSSSSDASPDAPEREPKRRRLLEPSSVSNSPAPFQPDTAFLEAIECLEGPSPHLNDPGDLSLYDPGNEDNGAFGFESCAAPHEVMSFHEDSGMQVHIDEASNSVSYDMTDRDHGTVCFGTIPSINARCERPRSSASTFAVTLESSERFFSAEGPQLRGIILPQNGQMIKVLLDDKALALFASCSINTDASRRCSAASYSQTSCSLDITVYGPIELFDEIGEWFQDYNVYLQDPQSCDLDVRYCNPQRLSSSDLKVCPYVSHVVSLGSRLVQFQEIDEQPDLLDIISGQDDLEEAIVPRVIRAALHKHQKQALTFMLGREQGWNLETKGADVWEALDSTHDRMYFNRIADLPQTEAPPQFYGGIIADPMGLGKTLTMIALAATDLEPGHSLLREDDLWDDPDDPEDPKPSISATLVIVPQPLLSPWEEQLSEHVTEGGMKFRRHHGKEKLNDIHEADKVNIVLTTYHTLSAEWNKWKSSGSSIMFSVRWRRIILDEAHLIRNMKTRMARAICDLESASRWAVTGTPIQNHLSDLTALLKFIRAYPYDDPKRFEVDISRLWKSGEDEEAVKRLKRLSRCLILRRAKRTINLPSRRDVRCKVEFSKEERALYDDIRQQTIKRIDDALLHDIELSKPGTYVNFLQQIESMRLVCNLGLHYNTRHDKAPLQDTMKWAPMAQEAFNIQREMETISCSQCSSTLEMTESLWDENLPQGQDSPQFSRCLKYACAECSYKLRVHSQKMACGHTPLCAVAPVSVSNSAFEEVFGDISSASKVNQSSQCFPSKVEMLLKDLKGLPRDVKSIIFSTWRLTLDIIEAALNQAGIRSVRFDGKVPQSQRQPVLNEFKSNPNVRVILLTLQCGAVGLTLTEASRAYLMEPHWNPTIEEQALARIHRIGQTREVTTVRFYIRESFEERVMETQESKKNLAGVLLSGHDGGQADDSLGALQIKVVTLANTIAVTSFLSLMHVVRDNPHIYIKVNLAEFDQKNLQSLMSIGYSIIRAIRDKWMTPPWCNLNWVKEWRQDREVEDMNVNNLKFCPWDGPCEKYVLARKLRSRETGIARSVMDYYQGDVEGIVADVRDWYENGI